MGRDRRGCWRSGPPHDPPDPLLPKLLSTDLHKILRWPAGVPAPGCRRPRHRVPRRRCYVLWRLAPGFPGAPGWLVRRTRPVSHDALLGPTGAVPHARWRRRQRQPVHLARDAVQAGTCTLGRLVRGVPLASIFRQNRRMRLSLRPRRCAAPHAFLYTLLSLAHAPSLLLALSRTSPLAPTHAPTRATDGACASLHLARGGGPAAGRPGGALPRQ